MSEYPSGLRGSVANRLDGLFPCASSNLASDAIRTKMINLFVLKFIRYVDRNIYKSKKVKGVRYE